MKTLPLALLLTAALAPLTNAQTETSVIGRDDMFRTVGGAWAATFTDYGLDVGMRDENGQTPFVDVPPFSTGLIALGETTSSEGTFLGMIHVSDFPGHDTEFVSHQRTLHQPLALDRYVQSTGPGYTSYSGFPHHARWELLVPHGATYGFQTQVGLLHTRADLDAHFFYEGVSIDLLDAQVGLVLRGKQQFLGSTGLVVRIACEGKGFDVRPDARLIHLARSSDGTTVPVPATARVIAWTDEQAFVFLDNTLGEGENIVLLSPNVDGTSGIQDPASLESFVAYPMHDVLTNAGLLPPEGDSLDGPPGGVTDCSPEEPGPPDDLDDCSPGSPNDTWSHFFFGQCDWTETGSGCSTETMEASRASCGPENGTTGRRSAQSLSGSLSVGGSIMGVEITSEGSYEVEVEESEGYTFKEGNGCGECWQLFVHYRLCVKSWQGWCHKYEPAPWATGYGVTIVGVCTEPCGTITTVCVGESSNSQNTCKRTCN